MDTRGRLYCTDRVTDPERKALYEKLEAERVCQFCPEGITRGLVKVIHEGAHWYIVENIKPYPGTRAHWVAVSRKHYVDPESRSDGVGDELLWLFGQFKRAHSVAGASMVYRSGGMPETCASLSHTHVHFVAAGAGTLGDKTFQIDLGYWPK